MVDDPRPIRPGNAVWDARKEDQPDPWRRIADDLATALRRQFRHLEKPCECVDHKALAAYDEAARPDGKFDSARSPSV